MSQGFRKILIANRGEIACRVIRTARRMGIATVAVCSDADADALHVRMADEAVRVGPASARESYLDTSRILEAVRVSGAQAVHPGYGFLSEDADFAQACAAAGVVFIGPPVEAIRAMGSKSAAKQLMARAGSVPMTPGYHGEEQDADFLAREATQAGYPVLIKASAGGGGKGMRRVDDPADFAAALAACKREAASSFGDDRVLVEKYVLQPRHIEIQVFGDSQGNIVSLFERDCSTQRRHQKVLEESPAPGMTPERRAAMGRAAVDAARAVGYVGAGTVEFISTQDGQFYFMEMNTRLQVEHPVTEMVTGLDLVEWQLRVAAGEPLPLTQEEICLTGHALEARIYAEDPDRDFLPATGRIDHLSLPLESASVRIDTGVAQGDRVTPWYDPMLAKLIVHGRNRDEALARMSAALAAYRLVGVQNNVDFLRRLVASPSFVEARIDTALIEREHDHLFTSTHGGRSIPEAAWLAAALAEAIWETTPEPVSPSVRSDAPWDLHDGWRIEGRATLRVVLAMGEEERALAVETAEDHCMVQGAAGTARCRRPASPRSGASDLQLIIDGRARSATVVPSGAQRHVFMDDGHWILERVREDQGRAEATSDNGSFRAPMPGTVSARLAPLNVDVVKGAPLVVIEAMKMEHTLYAPAAGKVTAFHQEVGGLVDGGELLLDFEVTP